MTAADHRPGSGSMILNPTNALSWRRRLCGIALPVLGALLLQALGATASEPRRFPRIVNGLETADFPATGALLYSSFGSMSSAPPVCTGTLIGCQTFLTAAHCIGPEYVGRARGCHQRRSPARACLGCRERLHPADHEARPLRGPLHHWHGLGVGRELAGAAPSASCKRLTSTPGSGPSCYGPRMRAVT